MISDNWIDYGSLLPLHPCECGGSHALRSYPVDSGWIVAVCCDTCRDKTGLPRRYSTETAEAFLTFDQAERSRKALLRFSLEAA